MQRRQSIHIGTITHQLHSKNTHTLHDSSTAQTRIVSSLEPVASRRPSTFHPTHKTCAGADKRSKFEIHDMHSGHRWASTAHRSTPCDGGLGVHVCATRPEADPADPLSWSRAELHYYLSRGYTIERLQYLKRMQKTFSLVFQVETWDESCRSVSHESR